MAERSSPRTIATIQRITGARHEHRPRLAVHRYSDRQRGSRWLATIAARTGLGARVARHSLSFGQSLWPLHARRFMTASGMSMILRRRRRRQQPAPAPRRYTWPLLRQGIDDAEGGRSTIGVFDQIPGDAEYETDDALHFDDELGHDDPFATPDESILARHEAFLGLPLRTDRAAPRSFIPPQPLRSERALDGSPLRLASRISGRFDGDGGEAFPDNPWQSPSISPEELLLIAATRGRSSVDAQSVQRTTGGLSALRRMGTVEPLPRSGSAVDFSTSLADRHWSATGELPTRQARSSRFAPITLALTRPSLAAQRSVGGPHQPATTHLAWPSAVSESVAATTVFATVPAGSPPGALEFTGRGYAEADNNQWVSGSIPERSSTRWSPWNLASPLVSRLPVTAKSWAADQSTAGGPVPYGTTDAGVSPIGHMGLSSEIDGQFIQWDADGHILPRARQTLGTVGRVSAAGAFPSGIRRMQTTAADLILRRMPGVVMRTFLGAEALRLLQWPAMPQATTPVGVDQRPPLTPLSSPVLPLVQPGSPEPPSIGGPLPISTGRVRRAMRVEPISGTLSPQHPVGPLSAPSRGIGVPSAFGLSTLGRTTTDLSQVPASAIGMSDAESTPVPPELVPPFAARRAERAAWSESLAIASPPPFLSIPPSGAPAVEVGRPITGVLRRLAFADAWKRPATGRSTVAGERAFSSAAAARLPLGRAGAGAWARAELGGAQPVIGAPSREYWPASMAAPGPSASPGTVGGWTSAEPRLPRSTFGFGEADTVTPIYARGWPTVASEQMVLQRRARDRDLASVGPLTRTGVSPFAAVLGSSPIGDSEIAVWSTRGVATSPQSSPPPLPVIRAKRRSIMDAAAIPMPTATIARWPVFRSALPDVAEPSVAQRSTAAEAMAASEGQALPPLVRRSMEHLFRMDLASVRVHTGAPAARATGAVAARAMAHGTDIYLPGGVDDSPRGADMPLLAHELTHVAHHLGHRPPAAMPSLTLARRSAPEEHDADQIERMVADAVQDQATARREPATALTLARRPAPVTIMRVEDDGVSSNATENLVSRAGPATAATGTGEADKTEQLKQTDKLAEEIFRRLERRLIVARERGGHRW